MLDVTVGDDSPQKRETSEWDSINQGRGGVEPPPPTEPELPQGEDPEENPLSSAFMAYGVFIAALLIYIVLSFLSTNEKYVDFGDGNYLYLSWRMMEGEVLYQDLPSPQPPLLLFLGSYLLQLGGGETVFVRFVQILIHCLTACCVWGIAKRIFQWNALASLAATTYLFLPEGLWWATGFQSEPLLVLLQSFNVLLFLDAIKKERPSLTLTLCAIAAGLCCFTNMTALPYVLLQWFFVGYLYRHLLARYSLALLATVAVGLVWMWVYSDGQYFYHVFARQVGTYPHDSLQRALNYFLKKLIEEGRDVLTFEGGFVYAAIAGMMVFAGQEKNDPAKPYLLWWGIFSLGSIIFVTKGGTVDYIFTLGEPAVSVFSAFFFLTIFLAMDLPARFNQWMQNALSLGKVTLVVCLFFPALLMMPLVMMVWVFTSSPMLFELSEQEVKKSSRYIQRAVTEHQMMIAPPYYAFHAKRKLVQNSSSLFILAHAYFNEWKALVRNEGLDLDLPGMNDLSYPYRIGSLRMNTQDVYELDRLFEQNPQWRDEYPAVALFIDIRRQMIQRQVPVVYVNFNHLFFAVPPLHQAIRDFYTTSDYQFNMADLRENRNREERIVIYERKQP